MTENLESLINKGRPYLRQYLEDMGVSIIKKGHTEFFSCINPDHDDKDPSNGFVRNTDDQQFHCFSCQVSGDVYTAASLLEGKPSTGLGFIKENVEYILNKYEVEYEPVEFTETQLNNMRYEAVHEAIADLMKEIDPTTGGLKYASIEPAKDRGWTSKICTTLGIGCIKDYNVFIAVLSKKTRLSEKELQDMGIRDDIFGPKLLTFIVRDVKGKIRGFASRYLDYKKGSLTPKYRNTAVDLNPFYKKEELLYCLDIAKSYNTLRLDIFEGYGSAVTAHMNGYKNCVAIGGTALTEAHVQIIRDLGFNHINLVLDQDNTGSELMEKYIEKFSGYNGLQITITHLDIKDEDRQPGQNDPDFYIQKYGINAFRKLKPEGVFEHMLKKHREALDIDNNPVNTKNFTKKVIPLIINEPDRINRSLMVKSLAAATGIDIEDIKDQIAQIEKNDVNSLRDDLKRKLTNARDADSLHEILSVAQARIENTSATKKDRYLLSLQESVEEFDSIFIEMNEQAEGIHGWVTGFETLDNMLDGIPKPNKGGVAIGFAGAPQHGKLCADDTQILTPKGFKNHGDLRVGDKVYSPEGKPIKVTHVHPKGVANRKVTFSDGEVIYCHENHEWVVYDTSAAGCIRQGKKTDGKKIVETKYLETVKLKKKGASRFLVDSNVTVEFNEKQYRVHPYVLGLWLGDGRATASDISHAVSDQRHIDKALNLYDNTKYHPRTTVWFHATTGVQYTSFKGLISDLRKYGLYNNKHIPQKYLLGSVEQRLELLAGLIDSDGYVYQKNGRICFSNTNKRLVDDVADLVRSLGSRATVAKFEPKESTSGIEGKQVTYQVTFNMHHAIPTALPRKRWDGDKNRQRRRAIVSVERIKPVQGNCITVEGGVYLCGKNLVPTHNSAAMMNIVVNAAQLNKDISICYWAIDDHRKAIAYRLVSMISGVPMKKVRNTERRTREEEIKIKEAQDLIRELTLSRKLVFKDDKYGRSKAKAERWIKDTQDASGNDILFCVDSLHNVQGAEGAETRTKLLSTSTWIKSMCASVPCTIMATLELVKNKVKGEKPTLQQISESGKMEFDFDTIAVVWNQAQGNYCSVDEVTMKWGMPGAYMPYIELDFQKNKAGAGEKGSVFFKYNTRTTGFVGACRRNDIFEQEGGVSFEGGSGTQYTINNAVGKPRPPANEALRSPIRNTGW